MKPTKNNHFCVASRKHKILFDDKAKADNFIKYNKEDILEENGKAPVRSYFCIACGGWHVTSIESAVIGDSINDRDAKVLERRALLKGEEKELRHYISWKLKDARLFISIGKLDEAEDILDVCQLELESADHRIVSNLNFAKVTSMFSKTNYQFKVAKYLNDMTDAELEGIMQSEKNDKQDKVIVSTAKGVYLSRRLFLLLDNIRNGVNTEDSKQEYLSLIETNFKTKGSRRKEYFLDLLDE